MPDLAAAVPVCRAYIKRVYVYVCVCPLCLPDRGDMLLKAAGYGFIYSLSPAVAAVAETAPGFSVLTPDHTQSV